MRWWESLFALTGTRWPKRLKQVEQKREWRDIRVVLCNRFDVSSSCLNIVVRFLCKL
jgi:hypothetical protein